MKGRTTLTERLEQIEYRGMTFTAAEEEERQFAKEWSKLVKSRHKAIGRWAICLLLAEKNGFWFVGDDIGRLIARNKRELFAYLRTTTHQRALAVRDPYNFAELFEEGIERFYG